MKNKRTLKRFIAFLKKENVDKDYLNALKTGESYRMRWAKVKIGDESQWLAETVKSCPNVLLEDAFSWSSWSNNEKIDWLALDEKWRKITGPSHYISYNLL